MKEKEEELSKIAVDNEEPDVRIIQEDLELYDRKTENSQSVIIKETEEKLSKIIIDNREPEVKAILEDCELSDRSKKTANLPL